MDAYHAHIQETHDFWVWADVLTLEEGQVNRVPLIDGQVNLNREDTGPRRTATITLSDPDNALTFGSPLVQDEDGVLWVNRLVRVQHKVILPDYGDVISTPFIGLPTSVARKGGDLSMELGDKSLLMDHGVKPKTYSKGANAAATVEDIIRNQTGERNYSIPSDPKKLSGPYTIGPAEDATPWVIAQKIASDELGMRLELQADGKVVMEKKDADRDKVSVDHVLELPDVQADLAFINYAKVVGKKKASQVRELPSSDSLSGKSLGRNGAPFYRALIVEDDKLKGSAIGNRAQKELDAGSRINIADTYATIPFHHLDNKDLLLLPHGIGQVAFEEGSIPLGAGGNMTVGAKVWVSKPVTVRRAA